MFGLFKKEAPNSTFNNAVVTTLADFFGRGNRSPSGDELIQSVERLVGGQGFKLSAQQASSLRACAAVLTRTSIQEEVTSLARKMNMEMPRGIVVSAEALKQLLCRNAVLIDDEALAFMSKHGLR